MTTTLPADIGATTNAFTLNGGDGSGGDVSSVGDKDLNKRTGGNLNALNQLSNTSKTTQNNLSNISTSIGSANTQKVNDNLKRKKLKSRNLIEQNLENGYSKDHLDAWLESCLRNSAQTQVYSSSEFLEYNPQLMIPTAPNQGSSSKYSLLTTPSQPFQSTNMPNLNHYVNSQNSHKRQQQLALQSNLMNPSGPSYPIGNPSSSNQGYSKNSLNFMKHSNSSHNRFSMPFPYGGSNDFYQQHDGSQDFASLPPQVNIMGDNGALESEPSNTASRNIGKGFSDPCLLNPSDSESKLSGQISPEQCNQIPSGMENIKFFAVLMEQISLLQKSNAKISRNLHETKVNIEALKHAPTWGMRHRRDSLSGLSTHSQPMVFGGGFGSQSPAPTYHSGAYTPGMMTDVVREVKEAATLREDALLNRVKAMVEERQWSMNEFNLRTMRDIEELKSQISYLRNERKESNKRINRLESENKYLRQMLSEVIKSPGKAEVIYENESMRSRRPFPQARRSQSFNLNYGTVNSSPIASQSLEEQDELLHIIEPPSTTENQSRKIKNRISADLCNSCSSSDGVTDGVKSTIKSVTNGNESKVKSIHTPPTFALVSAVNSKSNFKKKPASPTVAHPIASTKLPNSDYQLQKQLNEETMATKKTDERIIALEEIVKNLQMNISNSSELIIPNGDGNNKIISGHIGDGSYLQSAKSSYNNTRHQALTTASTSVNMVQTPTKLNVTGPITDL